MKNRKIPAKDSLGSESFLPLHFSSVHESGFPIGPTQRQPRLRRRSEMNENCLYNPHHQLFEEGKREELLGKAEPSDIESAPIGSRRVKFENFFPSPTNSELVFSPLFRFASFAQDFCVVLWK